MSELNIPKTPWKVVRFHPLYTRSGFQPWLEIHSADGDDFATLKGNADRIPPETLAKYHAAADLMGKAPAMYDLLSEVGADLEMALNGAFAETAVNIKTWREILYEDVEKIKQMLKEARGEA